MALPVSVASLAVKTLAEAILLFSDHIIFVDESGDHSFKSIDPQYPIFALAFCIIRKDDYIHRLVPAESRAQVPQGTALLEASWMSLISSDAAHDEEVSAVFS
jgi:hypothetical protein